MHLEQFHGRFLVRDMAETNNNKPAAILGEALLDTIRQAVREEIQDAVAHYGYGGKKPPETLSPYLTIKDAATFSRLAPSTIRLYIRKRELKAHQVGGRVIIKRADLEQFLEAHPIEILPD